MSRPRIVDGRKKSPGANRKRDRTGNRTQNGLRNSSIKFEDKRSNQRKDKNRKHEKQEINERSHSAKKQEVCKYYLAQTCLKGM